MKNLQHTKPEEKPKPAHIPKLPGDDLEIPHFPEFVGRISSPRALGEVCIFHYCTAPASAQASCQQSQQTGTFWSPSTAPHFVFKLSSNNICFGEIPFFSKIIFVFPQSCGCPFGNGGFWTTLLLPEAALIGNRSSQSSPGINSAVPAASPWILGTLGFFLSEFYLPMVILNLQKAQVLPIKSFFPCTNSLNPAPVLLFQLFSRKGNFTTILEGRISSFLLKLSIFNSYVNIQFQFIGVYLSIYF